MVRLGGLGLCVVGLVLCAACGSGAASPKKRAVRTTNPTSPEKLPSFDEEPEADERRVAINHVLATGQSNAIATDATPPLTYAQPYANLKFDTGVMPARDCGGEGCRGYATPTRFVPLIEGDSYFRYGVETMSSGFANEASKLARERGTDHTVLVSLHGRSASTYRCLRSTGCDYAGAAAGYLVPFADGMQQVWDAMHIAKTAGLSYVVRAVTAIHGESDHHAYASGAPELPTPGTDGAGLVEDYGDAMIEWQRDYEASVKAITGQTTAVPLFLMQMSNWNDVPHSVIPTAQLDAHVKAAGKVFVVTPGYGIGYASDCLHFTNHQQRRIGEYFAKAYARVVLDGERWEPVRPRDVTRAGAVVTVRFHVPRPPLVLDTERVSDPGSYGFEYVDDSAEPPPIKNVAVVGPDTVAITLAEAPTGNGQRLRYAFTATPHRCPGGKLGPRGNLRDSDTTASNYGYDLFNWSVHFDEPVK